LILAVHDVFGHGSVKLRHLPQPFKLDAFQAGAQLAAFAEAAPGELCPDFSGEVLKPPIDGVLPASNERACSSGRIRQPLLESRKEICLERAVLFR
jgi:hypothetical protein